MNKYSATAINAIAFGRVISLRAAKVYVYRIAKSRRDCSPCSTFILDGMPVSSMLSWRCHINLHPGSFCLMQFICQQYSGRSSARCHSFRLQLAESYRVDHHLDMFLRSTSEFGRHHEDVIGNDGRESTSLRHVSMARTNIANLPSPQPATFSATSLARVSGTSGAGSQVPVTLTSHRSSY